MAVLPPFCRVCHNGCSILVEVEDGPVRVTGNHDSPLNVAVVLEEDG